MPDTNPIDRAAGLAAIGAAIAEKRDEAVKAASSSGLPALWRYCEEAYLGIDDSNRGDFAKDKWAKPMSMDGSPTSASGSSDGVKSTAFVRMTSRYVDHAAARISEIILPIDDKPFAFDATPVPDLINDTEDETPVIGPNGQPLMRNADEAAPPPAMPGQPPMPMGGMPPMPGQPPAQVPLTKADIAKKKIAKAKDAAKKSEERIYDYLVECNFPREVRKMMHDCARVGTGVIKGPVPDIVRQQAARKVEGKEGMQLEMLEKVVPVARWMAYDNLFPDPSCGENIHHGDYICERDYISPRMLKDLKGQPGYIKDQIDKVLKEGPGKCFEEGDKDKVKHRYEIWYVTGIMSREELALTETPGLEDLEDDTEDVFAIATMVNDTVIRATINPLDSGKFPYHVMNWSRRAGHWAGVGIGEQIKMPQSMANAATRGLLNNAGLSAGVQIVMDQLGVVPSDEKYTITPNKIWFMTPELVDRGGNANNAFQLFKIPNTTNEMMEIINLAARYAEEATNIPMLSQGQQGERMPDTFGATSLLDDNANTLQRDIVANYDESVLNPLLRQFHELTLLDPEVPDDEKGDFAIHTKGSALVERALQEQALQQLAQMSVNPAFKIDPAKLATEIMKAKRMDPRNIQFSEEDMAKMAQQPPPPPPQIAAAEIRAKAEMEKIQYQAGEDMKMEQFRQQQIQLQEQFKAQISVQIAKEREGTAQERIRMDTDRDTVYTQAQQARDQANHEATMAELATRRELAMLDYANKREMSLEQVKADLAQTAAKLQTQKELTAMALDNDAKSSAGAPQVVTPPTEPAGLAPDGQAFAK